MSTSPPPYVSGHRLLERRSAVVTAAAGAGIVGATAHRLLEGAKVVISDPHACCLKESAAELAEAFGQDRIAALPFNVTTRTRSPLFSTSPSSSTDVSTSS